MKYLSIALTALVLSGQAVSSEQGQLNCLSSRVTVSNLKLTGETVATGLSGYSLHKAQGTISNGLAWPISGVATHHNAQLADGEQLPETHGFARLAEHLPSGEATSISIYQHGVDDLQQQDIQIVVRGTDVLDADGFALIDAQFGDFEVSGLTTLECS